MNKYIFLTVLIFSLPVTSGEIGQGILRKMSVHNFKELGLEIWLDTNPKPIYKIVKMKRKPLLLIKTPENVYPPISMSVVSFENMTVLSSEFDNMFGSFLGTALQQFGLNHKHAKNIVKRDVQYGSLYGIEVDFQAHVHGNLSDVKVFLGKGKDKGPVLLQAYTLAGKMSHINGKLQRTWGNISYLK